MTISRLVPRLSICRCTAASAPRPILTIAITAATPMTMPSVVNAERSTLRRNARSAASTVMRSSFMTEGSHGEAG